MNNKKKDVILHVAENCHFHTKRPLWPRTAKRKIVYFFSRKTRLQLPPGRGLPFPYSRSSVAEDCQILLREFPKVYEFNVTPLDYYY